MNKNVCKNYNDIVNCEFLDEDLFSKKLVEYYKKTIEKETNTDRLIKIDAVLKKYIDDYNFSKRLQDTVDYQSIERSKLDLTDMVLDYVVDFFSKYDERMEETIVNTRWI